jgi:hypothetical protein
MEEDESTLSRSFETHAFQVALITNPVQMQSAQLGYIEKRTISL